MEKDNSNRGNKKTMVILTEHSQQFSSKVSNSFIQAFIDWASILHSHMKS